LGGLTSKDVWTNVAIGSDQETAEKVRALALENYREATELGFLDMSSLIRGGGELLFHLG